MLYMEKLSLVTRIAELKAFDPAAEEFLLHWNVTAFSAYVDTL